MRRYIYLMHVSFKIWYISLQQTDLKNEILVVSGLIFINPEADWCQHWMMTTLHEGELIFLIAKCIFLENYLLHFVALLSFSKKICLSKDQNKYLEVDFVSLPKGLQDSVQDNSQLSQYLIRSEQHPYQVTKDEANVCHGFHNCLKIISIFNLLIKSCIVKNQRGRINTAGTIQTKVRSFGSQKSSQSLSREKYQFYL